MSFRRIPFQFSSTDPVERQAELDKRFGLHSRNNMHVDFENPLAMGASGTDLNLSSSSPRLQHRVPIFLDGCNQPVKSSVDSVGTNIDAKKSNVRVIPIEIEGDPISFNRHRTFSGPAGWADKESLSPREDASPLKRSMQDLSQPLKVKTATGPKVHNVPIHFEGKSPIKSVKVSKSNNDKDHAKINGCVSSQTSKNVQLHENTEPTTKPKAESVIESSLKKIEKVLEELKSYETGVQEFVGTVKDKQYRYLDEMLTRCMLRLDDIETMGNDKVRSSRKDAVKKVQACIDLLETKIKTECEIANGEADNKLDSSDVQGNVLQSNEVDMKEMDLKATPESSYVNTKEITDIEMNESKDDQCEVLCDVKIPNEIITDEKISTEASSDTKIPKEVTTDIKISSEVSSDTKLPNEVTTETSSEVTEVDMTEFLEKALDSQIEIEMEENNSSEKETVTTDTAEESRTEMIVDIPNDDVNCVVLEGNKTDAESSNINEASKINLAQEMAHSILPENKIEVELSENPESEGIGQSLDNSIKCDVNMPEVTLNSDSAQNLSADVNIDIPSSDQISTEL